MTANETDIRPGKVLGKVSEGGSVDCEPIKIEGGYFGEGADGSASLFLADTDGKLVAYSLPPDVLRDLLKAGTETLTKLRA